MATLQATHEHMGETQGIQNHDYDLLQDLGWRLNALWRYDQFIANADGKPDLQNCWRQLKKQEIATVDRLKGLIADEVRADCF